MAKSLKLDTVISTPGVFHSDNPYVWLDGGGMKSDNDDLSYAPFHCHIVRDGKKNIDSSVTAAHIIYGEKQAIRLGLGMSGSANKFNKVNGWGKLFTTIRGPLRRKESKDQSGENWNQQSGYCPTMMTSNMIPHPTGIYLGRTPPDDFGFETSDDVNPQIEAFWNSKARWCTPTGVQFKWSSRGTKPASGAINFSRIALIYMDNWFPGRTLYMPLIDRVEEGKTDEDSSDGGGFGAFVNDYSFYRGSDPLRTNYGSDASGDKDGYRWFGEVVAYAQPEVRAYMADPWTRAVCVGMYIELLQPKGQGANYDICREVFDFKLLFDMPDERGNLSAANSQIIYPAPYPLREAIFGDRFDMKLL